jgi:hypothetical protein
MAPERKKRELRPRTPIVVAPLAISTENCIAVGGLVPHKFRAAADRFPDIPRSRLGHTLLMQPEHFAELLERLRVDAGAEHAVGDDDDAQPTTAAAVLRELGRELVP